MKDWRKKENYRESCPEREREKLIASQIITLKSECNWSLTQV